MGAVQVPAPALGHWAPLRRRDGSGGFWAGGSSWSSLSHLLPPACQLLDSMYNMTFRARGKVLRFDTTGNVDMDYDLKLWVWRGPVPELRTVGTFSGRLQLQHSRMCWHTPGNKVSTRLCPQPHSSSPKARSELWPHLGGSRRLSPGLRQVPSAEPSLSREAPMPGARIPVLAGVRGGPGAPCEGLPLLLLRLCGLQSGQLPAQAR